MLCMHLNMWAVPLAKLSMNPLFSPRWTSIAGSISSLLQPTNSQVSTQCSYCIQKVTEYKACVPDGVIPHDVPGQVALAHWVGQVSRHIIDGRDVLPPRGWERYATMDTEYLRAHTGETKLILCFTDIRVLFLQNAKQLVVKIRGQIS